MDCYEVFSILVLPLFLIHFIIDYLSDSQITSNFLKIGILQFLHHLINVYGLMIFFTDDKWYYMITVVTIYIIQLLLLKNNEYCILTKTINTLINPDKPNRKWMGYSLNTQIKHYLYGKEYANSDMKIPDNTVYLTILNIVYIVLLLKLIYKNRTNNF
jgi:hypothetical protein